MKFYEKINNEFIGFYDSEIHKELLFDEFGKLKTNYFELSEKKWTELLNGQSEGKEIKILKNGELGLFEKPLPPQEFYRPIWNEIEEEWEEGADRNNLIQEKKKKVLKLRKLKEEINTLKEIAEIDEELADLEMIEMTQKEYDLLKFEILELNKIIKSLQI